jgi:creatinine amidohydrolase
MIRELQVRTRVFLATINWYSCVDPRPYFSDLGDHAGELETSVMMHVAPELVRPLAEAGPGRARRWRVAGLREGWAWAPRRWTSVSDDTGVGDPSAATPEKGARFVEAVVRRVAGFLVELAAADPARLYEDPQPRDREGRP